MTITEIYTTKRRATLEKRGHHPRDIDYKIEQELAQEWRKPRTCPECGTEFIPINKTNYCCQPTCRRKMALRREAENRKAPRSEKKLRPEHPGYPKELPCMCCGNPHKVTWAGDRLCFNCKPGSNYIHRYTVGGVR